MIETSRRQRTFFCNVGQAIDSGCRSLDHYGVLNVCKWSTALLGMLIILLSVRLTIFLLITMANSKEDFIKGPYYLLRLTDASEEIIIEVMAHVIVIMSLDLRFCCL